MRAVTFSKPCRRTLGAVAAGPRSGRTSAWTSSPSPRSASSPRPPSSTAARGASRTRSRRASRCSGILRIAVGLASGAGVGAAALDLAAATAVFVAGAVAFRFRLLGGGDVKLIAAAALWLGAAALGPFLLATALAGGALAVGFLLARHARREGLAAGLPYGIAIAAGGILVSAGAAWA